MSTRPSHFDAGSASPAASTMMPKTIGADQRDGGLDEVPPVRMQIEGERLVVVEQLLSGTAWRRTVSRPTRRVAGVAPAAEPDRPATVGPPASADLTPAQAPPSRRRRRSSPSSPAPARARPGCSRGASPTASPSARPTPATRWPSRSPARPPASCAAACAAPGVRDHVEAGTFHAVALALLRQRWADLDRRPPTVVGDRDRLLAEVAGGIPLPTLRRRGRLGRGPRRAAPTATSPRPGPPGAGARRRPTASPPCSPPTRR